MRELDIRGVGKRGLTTYEDHGNTAQQPNTVAYVGTKTGNPAGRGGGGRQSGLVWTLGGCWKHIKRMLTSHAEYRDATGTLVSRPGECHKHIGRMLQVHWDDTTSTPRGCYKHTEGMLQAH